MNPRYPILIPSKGRHSKSDALTAKALMRDGVPFHVVVEPQEADAYKRTVGEERVLVLPFSNLGMGSTPARKWLREWAEERGFARHWCLDDNIQTFYRLWDGRRVPVHAGIALRVCEDLTDRFTNVGVSGLNYTMFVTRATPVPFYRNCHVYSCILINNAMPYNWRLRYNEDTDLCLQALTNGWATLAVNAFNAQKVTTMVMKGGNTGDLYLKGEEGPGGDRHTDTHGRYEMARSLERMWPGTVKVGRRFGRYQHTVNWPAFKDLPLKLREDLDLEALPYVDEYGMTLREVRPIKSDRVKQLLRDYRQEVLDLREPEDAWRGLPAFRAVPESPQVRVECASEEARAELIERTGVTISKKTRGTLSVWWPPRDRDDNASLRFEPETTLWRGLPDFRRAEEPPRLRVECETPEDRHALVERTGVLIDKKFEDKAWSGWWPPRSREDPASLRFEPSGEGEDRVGDPPEDQLKDQSEEDDVEAHPSERTGGLDTLVPAYGTEEELLAVDSQLDEVLGDPSS